MKLTVAEWTNVQNELGVDAESRRLWHWIEHRTFGKRWSQEVAIGTPGPFKKMAETALATVKDKREENATASPTGEEGRDGTSSSDYAGG